MAESEVRSSEKSDAAYPIDAATEGKTPGLPAPPVHPPRNSLVRILLVIAGIGCMGMAYLGSILPGLPTTPWLLLASGCFARSSPRLHRWLLRSPIFGKLLRDWHEHRGIRKHVKMFTVCLVILACSFSILFTPVPMAVKVVIGICGLIGLTVVVFVVPTIREPSTRDTPRS
jgi:uncharacterized protein